MMKVPELSDEELRQFVYATSSKPGGGVMEPKKIERNWQLLKKYYAAVREMKDDRKAVTAVTMAGADFGLTREIMQLARLPFHQWLQAQRPAKMSPAEAGGLGGKFSGISKRLDELDALYTETDDRIVAVEKKLDEYIAGVADVIDKLERRSNGLIGNSSSITALIKRMAVVEENASAAVPELNRRITLLENGSAVEQEQAKSWTPWKGK